MRAFPWGAGGLFDTDSAQLEGGMSVGSGVGALLPSEEGDVGRRRRRVGECIV